MNINEVEMINNENKNIFCPKCSKSINDPENNNKNSLEKNTEEFTKITCNYCFTEFCFISCLYCTKNIYIKIHSKATKYNGLNGFNIKCPYKSCEKIFYFTECYKCKRTQKQEKYIVEGSIITCIYNDCKCQYIQSNCPVDYCTDITYLQKSENHTNFPLGILSMHKKGIEAMFQKINCCYCWRPIVYKTTKSHKNKYCEGQKVICPYEDCKKTFNRIICPDCCHENYVQDGWYEMGSKIKCRACKNNFSKLVCPSCGKINTSKNESFKMGKITCGFQKCLKENYLINCIYCRKLNLFKNEIPVNGQLIKCGYCNNSFNQILCPFCKKKIPFPYGDFSFGKRYKCIYSNCLKEFQFIICPKCLLYTFSNEVKEGKKYKCDGCNVAFMNWGCPFCYSNIMDYNSSLDMGQMIKCPSKKCGKQYSFIRCGKCIRLIFSHENESILGQCVQCPYNNCGAYNMVVECPHCKIKTMYNGERNNYNEGDNVVCNSCKREFPFTKNREVYNNKLTILKEIKGDTIDFGQGEVDRNYLLKLSLFFDNRSWIYPSQFIYDNLNDKPISETKKSYKSLEECIVCHNNFKESIFYPCGHRCVCYNCAVILFAVNKECPRCNKKAECIIRKVYE
jgi:hypothetical protein